MIFGSFAPCLHSHPVRRRRRSRRSEKQPLVMHAFTCTYGNCQWSMGARGKGRGACVHMTCVCRARRPLGLGWERVTVAARGTPNHMRPMCGANPFFPVPSQRAERARRAEAPRRCGGAPSVRASWPSRPSILPHVSPPRGHRANHITLPVPGPAAARRRTPRTRERP
jgi:hypothetical protein